MKKFIIKNPKKGADIRSKFVAGKDEVRDEKNNVTNSKEFTFYKDSEMEVDEVTAEWALNTWQFLEVVKEIEEIVKVTRVEKVVETIVEAPESSPEPVLEPVKPSEVPIPPKEEIDHTEDEVNEDPAEFQCECGKVTKNNAGLKAHQRRCTK